MKVSYNWLKTYFPANAPLPDPKELAELFNAHFAEIESIEELAGDTVFDLKTLADRNHYALCHRGIAREAGVIAKKPLQAPVKPEIAPDGTVSKVSVNIEDGKLCRRYAARRVEGVSVVESPHWLSERLQAVGARSINNIVDATNFVMLDIGQPLHAFDADKVRGGITVRRARAGEKIVVLDGREIELRDTDLVIADEEGPLAIAGVKGGKRAEVTAETKNIIIESANFDPASVRRTSTRANLRNDSSKRFENEITPELASEAIDRVTALVLEVAGGKAGEVADIYPYPTKPWTVNVSAAYVADRVGLPISIDEVKDVLERQGCAISIDGDMLAITPPSDRLDLIIGDDIVDEVARIKGYDGIPSVDTPALSEATPLDPAFYWSERVKNALIEKGFSETLLYTLVAKGVFEVAYPLASDKSALRESLVPKLIDSLSVNARNADLLGLEAIKIFEIGKVFPSSGERTSLAIGVSLAKRKKGVTSESVLKDVLAHLEKALGTEIKATLQGATAEIDFDALVTTLGPAGALSDLDIRPLLKDKRYKPFSPYPFIVRDIALFVPVGTDESMVVRTIVDALDDASRALMVKGPDLFDRFEKDGRKSLAFRMVFQSFEKTLSDDEANVVMEKIYGAVKAKDWEVR